MCSTSTVASYGLAPDGTRTTVSTGLNTQNAIEALADGRVLIAQATALYEVSPAGEVQQRMGTGLATPEDLVIDSHGTVFIADRTGNRLVRFADGQLTPFVTDIPQPYGLAIDAADTIYVASFGSNSLLTVTPDGTVTTLATGLAGPRDVHLLPSGDLVVSNYNDHTLAMVSPAGEVTVRVPATLNRPQAAVYDAAGTLYVGNAISRNVVALSSSGPPTPLTDAVVPRALLAEVDGSLLVLESSRLWRVAPDGSRTEIARGLSDAGDLAATADGYVVSESFYHRLRHVDATGQVTPYVEAHFLQPRVLRTTAQGDLAVVSGQGYITTVTAAGQARRLTDGLSSPFGLAWAADGTLYVSDYGNFQLVAIDAAGTHHVVAALTFRPGALAVTAAGDLIVAPWTGTTLYRVDATGVHELAQLDYPVYYDMVVTTDGAVWATHNRHGRVSRLAPDGSQQSFTVGPYPRALAPDGQGGVYVGVYGGIRHFTSSGQPTDVAVGGPFQSQYIQGLGVAPDGHLWALNHNSILSRVTSEGQVAARYTTLMSPKGIAVHDGALIIANGNNTVVRLRAADALPEVLLDGAYKRVAVEPTGTLLLTTGTVVKRFDPTSGTLTDVATGFQNLTDVAVSPDGGLAVVDVNRNELSLYAPDGALQDRRIGLVNPTGLGLDETGHLLVANGYPNVLAQVREDGAVTVFSRVGGLHYMWRETDGRLTVSRGSRLDTLSATGELLGSVASLGATGVVRDAQGTLLVASSSGALLAYDAAGAYTKIASGLSQPMDVETTPAGVVYVADASRGAVLALSADNALTLVASGLPKADALAVDQDTLYVAYSGNHLATVAADGTHTELPVAAVLPASIRGLLVRVGRGVAAVDSTHSLYHLTMHTPADQPQPGDVVYSTTVPVPDLLPGAAVVTLDLGSFTPTVSGDFTVTLTPLDSATTGQLSTMLHVGASATGTLTLAEPHVIPGTQLLSARLHLRGADTTSLTHVDPEGATLAPSPMPRAGLLPAIAWATSTLRIPNAS